MHRRHLGRDTVLLLPPISSYRPSLLAKLNRRNNGAIAPRLRPGPAWEPLRQTLNLALSSDIISRRFARRGLLIALLDAMASGMLTPVYTALALSSGAKPAPNKILPICRAGILTNQHANYGVLTNATAVFSSRSTSDHRKVDNS